MQPRVLGLPCMPGRLSDSYLMTARWTRDGNEARSTQLATSTNLISNKHELNNFFIKFKCFLQCRGSSLNLFSLPIFSNQTDRKSILLPTAQTAKLQSHDNVPHFKNDAEWNFIRRYLANDGPECLHEIQKFLNQETFQVTRYKHFIGKRKSCAHFAQVVCLTKTSQCK